jgi:hypothetical protein
MHGANSTATGVNYGPLLEYNLGEMNDIVPAGTYATRAMCT